MVQVAGRPLLEWVLRWLGRNQIRRVVIGVAYRREAIMNHFKDGASFGLEIEYSTHTVEGGTAEGFRLAIERFVDDEAFFAMNGDELTDVSLRDLEEFHLRNGGVATIAVSPLRSPFGLVEVNGDDITAFREKAIIESARVSVGVYAFQRSILSYLPEKGDIERTAFPRLAQEGRLKAFRHEGFWMTVNTVKDLAEVEREIARLKG